MWSNPAFLFLQESLAHKQLSLITKTSLRGLDDSQARQWHDFVGAKTKDLQQPQQVWQAVDKRATLGGLESEDDAEQGHRFLAIFLV
jgi:hypothetical protein